MTPSRRSFLAAGLVLPAAASASRPEQASQAPSPSQSKPSDPGLRYATLGKTGLKVTTVGFGCMITSDGSVVQRAADLGITYFDTARSYQGGNNERMVGAALGAKRKDVVLSTKTEANNKEQALQQLNTSLTELGTDHVDIWYLHAKTSPAAVTDDLIEAQQIAKKAGKIRFAGVSTHGGQRELLPFLAKHPQIDVILTTYNFTMEPFMKDVIEAAAAGGKGIVAMKVMAGGFRRLQPTDPNYKRLKSDGGMLAALKWALRNPSVHTTVPSMTDMDQLEENIRAMAHPFDDNDRKILARQMQYIGPLYCRMCGECSGTCRQDLPVEDMLRFLTYAEGYGQFPLARQRFLELPREHATAKCSACPECTVQCPYGVKVSARMARAQDLFAC
jgi:uncharacterized protein